MTEVEHELIGAYDCAAHDGINGMVVVDQLLSAEFYLKLAKNLQKQCGEVYPGKCDPNCSVAKLISKLEAAGIKLETP